MPDNAVEAYYRAWTELKGDVSDVPLSDDFVFATPLGVLEGLEAFRGLAGQFGAAAVNFRVREQYPAGEKVCSIVQWELPGVDGTTTAAEILTLSDGVLTHGELLYDPRLVHEFTANLA